MNENVKILVCAHKQDYLWRGEGYSPIHVGRALSGVDLGFPGDDTGENISAKNGSYCELTAIYCEWKNPTGESIVGLNHYRRYFDFRRRLFPRRKTFRRVSLSRFKRIFPGMTPDIGSILGEAEMIIGNSVNHRISMEEHYRRSHVAKDVELMREVIGTVEPDYAGAFDRVMGGRRWSPCNMFICRRELFNDYCRWLFGILAEVERRLDTTDYPPYQKRVYGFMAERLMNVYIEKNGLRTKRFPILSIR